MKVALRLCLCLAVIAAPISTMATAKAPARVVSEQARQVTGGRALRVMVAQAEIKADINPSNLAVATGGGMLGGLLAAAQNAARTKKAEAALEPVRAAMTGFDADTLSLDTTRQGLATVAWMQPVDPAFSKDSSLLGKSAALDAGPAAQIAFIEYSYDMAPDFSSVRVVAKIEFADKAIPAAEESAKALAQVNAALASMGPVAGRSTAQLQAMAGQGSTDLVGPLSCRVHDGLERAHGIPLGCGQRHDGSERDHNAIAEKFVDDAAMRLDQRHDPRMQAAQELDDLPRRQRHRQSRESADVEHEDRGMTIDRGPCLDLRIGARDHIGDTA